MNDYTQLALIIGVIMGLIEIIKLLVSRITGNGSKGINDRIKELQENHLHNMTDILNRVDKRTEEMNGRLIQVVELLKLMSQKR